MAANEVRLRLAENGRVVIPLRVRRDLGVEGGGEIILEQEENGYRITAQQRRLAEALGLSLGDPACLALGISLGLPVYTADRVWKKLRLGIPVHLIR